MSLRPALVLAVMLPLVGASCATYRTVGVETSRAETQTASTNGLSASAAIAVFKHVAADLGYVIEGPHPVRAQYYAHAAWKAPGRKGTLWRDLGDEHINFLVRINGTKKDLRTAQSTAAMFERELDSRGVRYKTQTWTAVWPTLP